MKQVFKLLNGMVRDCAIPNCAIGGAIGAVFYVEPFATQHVDVLVLMDSEPDLTFQNQRKEEFKLMRGRLSARRRASTSDINIPN